MRKSAPTISDVAEKAGVNRVTASVVLNNSRGNTRVSEATRQRILAAAAELRYQPNAVALSLRRRRTDTIGFYSGDNSNDVRFPFFSQIISGLQKGCEQYVKDLLIHRRAGGRPVETVYAELVNGKVDGLILYAPPDDPLVRLLADSHLPTIAVADAVASLPSVVVDDAAGGRLQAEHLYRRGHKRILYHVGSHAATSVCRRREAFCAAAASYGLSVVQSASRSDYCRGELSDESRERLSRPPDARPTAIVCWEDLSAYRVLAECRTMGLHVPTDIAIVGFDGVEPFIEPAWRLTTVRAPWRELGYRAVIQLMAQLEGKEVAPETVLPVELVVGNTT
ncbi:MAG TPA: LacI family DNA-binding transcriptional regulator [Chthonomonadaceae bacterium]|nr:LacI family DNA-binding transcriptional regulator [Chthonomonadaceae bacterium]